MPAIAQQDKVGGTILHNYLGKDVLLILSVVSASAVSLWKQNEEDVYMAIVGICVIGGATWNHAFTPAILPLVYFANKLYIKRIKS